MTKSLHPERRYTTTTTQFRPQSNLNKVNFTKSINVGNRFTQKLVATDMIVNNFESASGQQTSTRELAPTPTTKATPNPRTRILEITINKTLGVVAQNTKARHSDSLTNDCLQTRLVPTPYQRACTTIDRFVTLSSQETYQCPRDPMQVSS